MCNKLSEMDPVVAPSGERKLQQPNYWPNLNFFEFFIPRNKEIYIFKHDVVKQTALFVDLELKQESIR